MRRDDVTVTGLAGYERRLRDTFVLHDHTKLRPRTVAGPERPGAAPVPAVHRQHGRGHVPGQNPTPKPGLRRIVTREMKKAGIRRRDLLRDGLDGMRTFG